MGSLDPLTCTSFPSSFSNERSAGTLEHVIWRAIALDQPIHVYLTRGELSEGRASWDSLALTSFCRYRQPAVLPLRARPVSKLFLKLRDGDGRLEWALKGITVRSGSSDNEVVSRLNLGKATLADATPTCKQHAGRVVTNGVQKLQYIESTTADIEPRARLPWRCWGHVLVRVIV